MILSYFLEHNRFLNIIGIITIIGIAVAFSRDRRAINYKLVGRALIIQFLIAFFMMQTALGSRIMHIVAQAVTVLYQSADAGINFVFGNLATTTTPWGFIFGIKVLPIIIFFGALMALLFHWGIVQHCVNAISYCIQPLLGTSGAETLCAIANSFLGQTEAPLLIRNYLKHMTKSEMLVVMVSGMATISGAILVVFAAMGVPVIHLLTSSVMAIPGALLIAKILYPETERSHTTGKTIASPVTTTENAFEAIAAGTLDGLQLALNVAAMLISFLSLLALINIILKFGSQELNHLFSLIHVSWQIPELNLNYIFAHIFAPFGYLLGFTGSEALQAGQLLGTKVTVNELIAYSEMIPMDLSERSKAIMTYALCGFSNFSCIGIQIGGIGALIPEKRSWLCELGILAVLGGSLSNLLSAMIAALLL